MAAAEFWYDFASTYSYPAAMRAHRLAEAQGVALIWRPFLLGPIFAANGWRDSPFNIYPAKGRYMWRDLERICEAAGLPFRRPEPFPQNSLLAARIALVLEGETRAEFSRRVFAAEFGEGRSIADRVTLSAIAGALGLDASDILARAESDTNKALLKAECARAAEIGIFGAPTLIADGEVFWGDDRLEHGLGWAVGRRR
jgi:2-hydroxychromene-2-carboxylate isomerase